MESRADFAQLQLHFVDHVQWRYEVIRPLILFEDRTAAQRAEETHTHPETVRKLTRRFRQQGILGLFPDQPAIVTPSRGQQVPEEVVEALARLKALYDGFQFRELARIIHYRPRSPCRPRWAAREINPFPPGGGRLGWGAVSHWHIADDIPALSSSPSPSPVKGEGMKQRWPTL